MFKKPKVLTIGLDGAAWEVMLSLVAAGKLPNIHNLMSRGSWGILNSTLHPSSPPAWASFQTGCNPGRHGVYDFQELRIDKPPTPISSRSIKTSPFWQLLAPECNVILVNVLGTYPIEPVNGVMISGRLTPPGAPFVYPSTLEQEINDAVGGYVVDVNASKDPFLSDITEVEYLGRIRNMVEIRTKTMEYLLESRPWNFAMVLFSVPDVVQHRFWCYLPSDLSGSGITSQDDTVQSAVQDTYVQLDESIGRLVQVAPKNTNVILMSDHGFGPLHKQVNLNYWLAREGLLAEKRYSRRWINALIKRVIPKALHDPLRRLKGRVGASDSDSGRPVYLTMPVDWQNTKAYATGRYGNIFVNLKGREPEGQVAPGLEYESICEEIAHRLTACVNPITGRPLVKAVHRREDIYHGPYVDNAADLVVEWDDYGYLAWYSGNVYGDALLQEPRSPTYRHLKQCGSHRKEGVVVAQGPSFHPGGQLAKPLNIMDIAPTILYLLGDVVPTYMDGQVASVLIDPEHLRLYPVQKSDDIRQDVAAAAGDKEVYSKTDTDAVLERLKALGYLE